MLAENVDRKELAQALLPAVREELKKRGELEESTVYGFVCPERGHTHSIVFDKPSKQWNATTAKPDVFLAAILERVVKSTKRFIVIYGGRGSGKSIGIGDIVLCDARDNGTKTYCLREYQSSIRNSVHSLLKNEIERLDLENFDVLQNAITHDGNDAFEFAGLARNTSSIKSAYGFGNYWGEESQGFSEQSLRDLTPTARSKPNKGLPKKFKNENDLAQQIGEQDNNVSMYFVANLASTEDPFSKRFINPYWEELEEHGSYEDDLHLIIRVNHTDNPWFEESGLEEERLWDEEHLEPALYEHIWEGAPNDSVESALILSQWFDACIDAHVRLGWKPQGARISSHDPSDTGPDPKGYVMRHGSVVLRAEESDEGNVNEGGHWAAALAIEDKADAFSWDDIGVGAGLAEQMAKTFNGKSTQLSVFTSSETPDNPDSIYKPSDGNPVSDQRFVKDVFKNKSAQYAWELRDRIYRTYRWVIHGEAADPDQCISFSSDITELSKLKSECCRIPIKPNNNGFNQLYPKPEMKKMKIKSPNLFDSLKQTMRHIPAYHTTKVVIPRPIKPMGMR